ncbi:MAG: NAD(P)/FAD-dependent oxidoreductase [Acidobacteriota bacterium]
MRMAIVGGGPAGALAAGRLAAAGRSVILFHHQPWPEKPCGGGIPSRGLEMSPELLDARLPRRIVSRLLLVSPSGRRAEIELDAPVHVFSRARLDRFLRERAVEAGATLISARVCRIERGAGTGRESFRLTDGTGREWVVGYVAGADGASSLVRRHFIGSHPPRALSQALGWYIDGARDDRMIVRFEHGLAGYQWCFPREDHLAIGICAPLGRLSARDLKERCRRFARWLGHPVTAARPYAALIPGFARDGDGRVVIEGAGWALLGDAAGAVDPLTREGLHHALETARLWTGSVLDPAGGTYTARFEAFFSAELQRAARQAERFFAPAFTERLVRYADASPAIRRVLSDLVAGRQPYATLRRRLLRCAVPLMVSMAVHRVTGGRSISRRQAA